MPQNSVRPCARSSAPSGAPPSISDERGHVEFRPTPLPKTLGLGAQRTERGGVASRLNTSPS
eukprot:1568269-Prymnesium_polylepis.1